MGILGGLFGRSSDPKTTATDRCMECGMAGGKHTDWCPAIAQEASEVPPVAGEADRQEDGQQPG